MISWRNCFRASHCYFECFQCYLLFFFTDTAYKSAIDSLDSVRLKWEQEMELGCNVWNVFSQTVTFSHCINDFVSFDMTSKQLTHQSNFVIAIQSRCFYCPTLSALLYLFSLFTKQGSAFIVLLVFTIVFSYINPGLAKFSTYNVQCTYRQYLRSFPSSLLFRMVPILFQQLEALEANRIDTLRELLWKCTNVDALACVQHDEVRSSR